MTQTIGQQLKKEREKRNLSIEKIVQATRIRAHAIEAIEADDFEALPSPVQARGFLRIYAEYLGLSLDDLIARQREGVEQGSVAQTEAMPAGFETIAALPESAPTEEPASLPGILSRLTEKFFPKRSEPAEPVDALEPSPGVDETPGEAAPRGRWFARLREKIISLKTDEIVHEIPRENAEEADEPELPGEEIPPASTEPSSSQLIFSAIGESLRQRRETLSLTLDEIERHTHVRKRYLQALEDGEFNSLPSSVQARGMVNNYATFLNMDLDAILLQFAEGLQAQRIERQQIAVETPEPAGKFPFKFKLPFQLNLPPAVRRYLSMDILVGGGLVILLMLFAGWGTSRIVNLRSATTPQPTAPSISNILASNPLDMTATPSATSIAIGGEVPSGGGTSGATLPASGTGAVQVLVIASERAFVRVTVDGKIKFDGRVEPGAAYAYDGDLQIEVLTGDGSAIRIQYNQSDLGPMGNFGEVVDRIYTANAILNPTPTATNTPTITLTPTATPRPSTTPRPSSTPRITPTK